MPTSHCRDVLRVESDGLVVCAQRFTSRVALGHIRHDVDSHAPEVELLEVRCAEAFQAE